MNANRFHNILNFIGLIFGALLVADWQSLGFPPEVAVVIAGWVLTGDKIIKLVMNLSRDGFAGLWKVQPPVEK